MFIIIDDPVKPGNKSNNKAVKWLTGARGKRLIDTVEEMANDLYKAWVMKPGERLDFSKELKALRDENRKAKKKIRNRDEHE